MIPAIIVISLVSFVSGASVGKEADSFDWRNTPGVVSSVKDQDYPCPCDDITCTCSGKCNAAWAFAAAGLWEGSLMSVYNKTLTDLSAQNIIDCTHNNEGCQGGFPYGGVFEPRGIQAESDYPYEGTVRRCRFNADKAIISIDKGTVRGSIMTKDIKEGEALLKSYIPVKGPIAAVIDGSSDSFKNYKSGVYYNPDCSQEIEDLKHGLLLVGYGSDPKEGDYWIAKNSLGTQWGENGYIRIARNKDNNCGLHRMAVYLA